METKNLKRSYLICCVDEDNRFIGFKSTHDEEELIHLINTKQISTKGYIFKYRNI